VSDNVEKRFETDIYIVHWLYNYMFRPCILAAVQYVRGVLWGELLVKFTVQPDDGQYTGPKHVVVYPVYYSM